MNLRNYLISGYYPASHRNTQIIHYVFVNLRRNYRVVNGHTIRYSVGRKYTPTHKPKMSITFLYFLNV